MALSFFCNNGFLGVCQKVKSKEELGPLSVGHFLRVYVNHVSVRSLQCFMVSIGNFRIVLRRRLYFSWVQSVPTKIEDH